MTVVCSIRSMPTRRVSPRSWGYTDHLRAAGISLLTPLERIRGAQLGQCALGPNRRREVLVGLLERPGDLWAVGVDRGVEGEADAARLWASDGAAAMSIHPRRRT